MEAKFKNESREELLIEKKYFEIRLMANIFLVFFRSAIFFRLVAVKGKRH